MPPGTNTCSGLIRSFTTGVPIPDTEAMQAYLGMGSTSLGACFFIETNGVITTKSCTENPTFTCEYDCEKARTNSELREITKTLHC